jgi:putative addiction module CopG family antidote
MMADTLPPELGQFVQHQLAAGRYRSEQELVVDAVRVLREVEVRHQQFCDDVRVGMDQLQRGEFVEYDDDGLRGLLEQLKRRVRDCGAAGGKKQ